ncbi:MAG: phosphoribosylformylglycinamidine synthase subunit PurQ [Gemmatimonadota bacterium]|nr:MAG: phosphoribosylformylglycinamidine synthase subunit PurQ [Gemmatimonadota bacterium]
MRTAVVTFPGSNCDYDVYQAIKSVGGDPTFTWHRDATLDNVDAVVLPGGFSYGDYLRGGAIARMSPIMDQVVEFAEGGGPVLGICNGFQILCEAGLLPGALTRNDTLKFESKDVRIRVENADTIFSRDYGVGQVLRMPIAHAEGNYYADQGTLDSLESGGQVVFRYCDPSGGDDGGWNPNGSARSIAGIRNEAGNILGMMPHPERAVEEVLGSVDGLGVFTSLVRQLSPAVA